MIQRIINILLVDAFLRRPKTTERPKRRRYRSIGLVVVVDTTAAAVVIVVISIKIIHEKHVSFALFSRKRVLAHDERSVHRAPGVITILRGREEIVPLRRQNREQQQHKHKQSARIHLLCVVVVVVVQ